MRSKVDATGLDGLEAVFREAQREVGPEAKKVLKRGAQNIKTDAGRIARDSRYAPNYWRTITYDLVWIGNSGYAEIGPDKTKQVGGGPHRTPGNLGHIYEYGLPGQAPQPALAPAAEAEEPRFIEQVERLGQGLLE